jgi:hypothetical protein
VEGRASPAQGPLAILADREEPRAIPGDRESALAPAFGVWSSGVVNLGNGKILHEPKTISWRKSAGQLKSLGNSGKRDLPIRLLRFPVLTTPASFIQGYGAPECHVGLCICLSVIVWLSNGEGAASRVFFSFRILPSNQPPAKSTEGAAKSKVALR